jgi:hypothetical protein
MAHPIILAQDALKAIVAARPAFAGVDVREGGPTEAEDITMDAFWFNDVQVSDDWSAISATRPRRVTFQLGFTIAVLRYGDDEREGRAQALVYFEDFLAAIKANPNLTNTVQQVEQVTGTVGSAPVNPSVWGAWFTGALTVISKQY